MIRKVLSSKDKKLRQKSKPVKKVDKKILRLIADLKQTLEIQRDPEGVGLAAPQIGKNQRVFVTKYKDKTKVFINPTIISKVVKSKKEVKAVDKKIMEGCLSLPNFYGPLKRPQKIKVRYINEDRKKVTELFEGFDAQIIQHEIDHLNGILFVDRLLEQKRPLYELVDDEWEKVEI